MASKVSVIMVDSVTNFQKEGPTKAVPLPFFVMVPGTNSKPS